MAAFLNVYTGDVRASFGDGILLANAIGSCVACGVYDPAFRIGAMAHIMLPGKSGRVCGLSRFKYAADGIAEMLRLALRLGADPVKLRGFCAGGGNVLRRKSDTICAQNIASCIENFARLGLPLTVSSLGGFERRRVSLDIGSGRVHCAVGDGPWKLLWCPEMDRRQVPAAQAEEVWHAHAAV